jgi:uncharacterized membrane protein YjgN (DUF898 family)
MALRPRSTGEILDGAFRLYAQDVGLYASTAILASLPFGLMMVLGMTSTGSTQSAVMVLVLMPVALIAAIAIWTALVIQMHERLEGREPKLGPAVRRSLALLLRVVWAGVIAYAVILGGLFAAGMVVVLLAGIASVFLPSLVVAVVSVVAAIALFLWLGLRVLAGAFLFLPGVSVENLSGYQSVKRGFALAKGGQGRILAVMIVSWLLVAVPMMATYFLTGTASMLVNPEALTDGTVGMGQLVTQQFLIIIIGGFATPYMAACILLLYFDQRIRLEAFDLQSEAEALAG